MKRAIVFAGCLLVLAACSVPFQGEREGKTQGEMGSFTLLIGSSGTISRSAVSYPPSSQADYDQLKFVVKFVNGDSVVREFSQEKNSEISGTVPVGSYTVTVDVSVIADNSLFASGSSSNVQINPGHNPTIRVDVYGAIHVSVSPTAASVGLGQQEQFTATLTPASANQSVNWTVTGNTQSGTVISTSGLLTVDAGEALGTVLTVRASSAADPSKYAEAAVTVSIPVQPSIALNITFDQISNPGLGITGPTLSRSGAGVNPQTASLTVTGTNTSVQWRLYGITVNGDSITLSLNSGNPNYNASYDIVRTHFLTVIVERNGILYSNTVSFTVLP